MIGDFPVSIPDLGIAGVCIWLLILFMRGRIRSDREITELRAELRADRDARVEAAERREEVWRQAYLAAEERGRVRDDQVSDLLEMNRTMTQIWEEVRDRNRPQDRSGS